MIKHSIDQDRMRFLFDCLDGVIYRKNLSSAMSNKEVVGERAGTLDRSGYISTMVDGKVLKVHRIVWSWHNGDPGEKEIDHINGDPSDNRIENLRLVDKQENLRNKKKYTSNRSGVSGVSWHSRSSKWLSRISIDGKRVSLGYFSDFFEAACARKSAERLFEYHLNHGR